MFNNIWCETRNIDALCISSGWFGWLVCCWFLAIKSFNRIFPKHTPNGRHFFSEFRKIWFLFIFKTCVQRLQSELFNIFPIQFIYYVTILEKISFMCQKASGKFETFGIREHFHNEMKLKEVPTVYGEIETICETMKTSETLVVAPVISVQFTFHLHKHSVLVDVQRAKPCVCLLLFHKKNEIWLCPHTKKVTHTLTHSLKHAY